MTNFSFGGTDGRTERGNNNIPEHALESAGIINRFTNIITCINVTLINHDREFVKMF